MNRGVSCLKRRRRPIASRIGNHLTKGIATNETAPIMSPTVIGILLPILSESLPMKEFTKV
ncbi:hypothetical protein DRO55_05590 [Candidatus Bathyarchaeota archaeon]|nr:MAG: hypothetical protein DRO55_05590 [Candidatus Bathyarchaeota archaeon]